MIETYFAEEIEKIAMPMIQRAPRALPRTPTLSVKAVTAKRAGVASTAPSLDPARKTTSAPSPFRSPVLTDAGRANLLSSAI